MHARRWAGLVLAASIQACASGGPSSPHEELPPDTLDHDAAHRFAGSWFGVMRLTLGEQGAQEPVALNITATGRNEVGVAGMCGDSEGLRGRVTSDGDLVLAGRECPIPTNGCTARWTIRRGAALRASGPVLTLTLEGPIHGCGVPAGSSIRLEFTSQRQGLAYLALPHQVLDARYDVALDRIVMIDAATRAVYLYDPTTGTEVSVPLPHAPRCLALSPDGGRALVGHAGWISTVDLAEGRLVETRPTDVDAGACARGVEWAYLFPAEANPVPRSVHLATHVEPRTPYPGQASSGVLSPDGSSLYAVDADAASLARWDVGRGAAVFGREMPYSHQAVGAQLWLDAAGARLFTSAGTAFRMAPGQTQDLADAGRLEGFSTPFRSEDVRYLEATADEIAVVPAAPGPSAAQPYEATDSLDDSRIQRYDPGTLARRGAIILPYWLTAQDPIAVHGRFAFHGKNGVMHAIVQADTSAELARGWAILHLQGDEPTPASGDDHGSPIASIAPTADATPGTPLALDGSASADPDGRQLSYAWTVLTQPPRGSGSFSASTAASTLFTPSVEGEYQVQLEVTAADGQRGVAILRVVSTRGSLPGLDHAVDEARYSRALDRIAMTDAAVAALFVLDPRTGEETRVALGATPSCLSVSPDGRSALVGHPGSLSIVDLEQGEVVDTHSTTTDPSDCVLAGNGWAYLFPSADQWEELHGIELATGSEVLTPQWSLYAGARAQLADDGAAVYSVTRGLSPISIQRWDITQGAPAQAWQYRSDLYTTATQLWVVGSRVYAGDATWLTVGGALADVAPAGVLSGLTAIQALDATENEVAVVGKQVFPDRWADPDDTTVELLDPALLGHLDRIPLPTWTLGGAGFATHGRFVFHAPDGRRYVIVERLEGPAGAWFSFLTL